jgi:hypothetical protein
VGEGNELTSQGRTALFVVFDRNPDSMGDCSIANDPDNNLQPRPVNYKGLCKEGENAIIENPAGSIGAGIDGTGCLPDYCCANIQHLCGVELCPLCDEESCPGLDLGDRLIRQGPTRIVGTTMEGKNIPNCIPYEMPGLCCD